jgi:hypothetical protein
MNSSIAASMMAPRRSAARSARLEGALADWAFGLGALADAAFSLGRPMVDLGAAPSFVRDPVRELGMTKL